MFLPGSVLSEVQGVERQSRLQDSLDNVDTAANLTNINVKKTKEMRLGAGARKQPIGAYQDSGADRRRKH